jgi:hypothetical protein
MIDSFVINTHPALVLSSSPSRPFDGDQPYATALDDSEYATVLASALMIDHGLEPTGARHERCQHGVLRNLHLALVHHRFELDAGAERGVPPWRMTEATRALPQTSLSPSTKDMALRLMIGASQLAQRQ